MNITKSPACVFELEARNHPGTMSHICGLFARRAYNLEGIICLPTDDPTISRIWLLVKETERVEQITQQVTKLYDVLSVKLHYHQNVFTHLNNMIL